MTKFALAPGGYAFTMLISSRSSAADYYAAMDQLCYGMMSSLKMTGAMSDQFDVFL